MIHGLGYRVVVIDEIEDGQAIKLSSACPCSEDVRRDFNAWLLDMFGGFRPAIVMNDSAQTIYVSQRGAEYIKRAKDEDEAPAPVKPGPRCTRSDMEAITGLKGKKLTSYLRSLVANGGVLRRLAHVNPTTSARRRTVYQSLPKDGVLEL